VLSRYRPAHNRETVFRDGADREVLRSLLSRYKARQGLRLDRLNQVRELSENGNRLGKSLAFHRDKVFLHRFGRIFQALPLPLGGGTYDIRSEVKLVGEKIVWVLALNSKSLERLIGKVLQVESNDHRYISKSRNGAG